jgi:hypothetical protein
MEQRETSTGTSAPDCSISRVEHALGPLRGRWKNFAALRCIRWICVSG